MMDQDAGLEQAVHEVTEQLIEGANRNFTRGGYVTGPMPPLGGCVFTIHPDECMIRAEDARAGRLVCGRVGHPTATSDCGRALPS